MSLHDSILPPSSRGTFISIYQVSADTLKRRQQEFTPEQRNWIGHCCFKADAGQIALIPASDGSLAFVLFGLGEGERNQDLLAHARLSSELPAGRYRFADQPDRPDLTVLAWILGTYRFSRYTEKTKPQARLCRPDGVDAADVSRIAAGVFLTRDLVNTPANDMGPSELEAAAQELAKMHRARVTVISGEALLKKGYPLIHAVGRASEHAPRLIDMSWGNKRAPLVTLVGKGVCFDTGGLDLKPSSNMLLMKKDMGGAANVLGLAHMIMDANLPVRLRVLIPAVENSVSSNAFRPGDVLKSRHGMSVEIGNTDAEGRLVLADALTEACSEKPDLIIDMATLTGAARVALGPDLPPFYTANETLAQLVTRHSQEQADPVWRLPLWRPYDKMLESKVADVNNVGGAFAGSITAALFLRRFVGDAQDWLHFDVYAWTPSARPGRPEGGEAQAIRTLYAALKEKYAR